MAQKTILNGIKCAHQIITPLCRANRGTGEAWREAVRRVESAYERYATSSRNTDVNWHLVLVREQPVESGPASSTL
jgi:hypothetical protein